MLGALKTSNCPNHVSPAYRPCPDVSYGSRILRKSPFPIRFFHRLCPAVARTVPLLVAAAFGLSGCGTTSDRHTGKAAIVIELHTQKAYLYKGESRISSSKISTGREGHNTPVGQFSVLQKDIDHHSSVYGYYADASGHPVKENIDARKGPMPPGTHFVGASMPFFLEFSPGFGMHQGYLPGFPASHGCVRMPYRKARQFYEAASIGTPVTVKP